MTLSVLAFIRYPLIVSSYIKAQGLKWMSWTWGLLPRERWQVGINSSNLFNVHLSFLYAFVNYWLDLIWYLPESCFSFHLNKVAQYCRLVADFVDTCLKSVCHWRKIETLFLPISWHGSNERWYGERDKWNLSRLHRLMRKFLRTQMKGDSRWKRQPFSDPWITTCSSWKQKLGLLGSPFTSNCSSKIWSLSTLCCSYV